jgi:hypothetical protein
VSAVAELDRWRQRRVSGFGDRLEQSLLDAFDVAGRRPVTRTPVAIAAAFGVGVATGVGMQRLRRRTQPVT